jgi:hypothetical protein
VEQFQGVVGVTDPPVSLFASILIPARTLNECAARHDVDGMAYAGRVRDGPRVGRIVLATAP